MIYCIKSQYKITWFIIVMEQNVERFKGYECFYTEVYLVSVWGQWTSEDHRSSECACEDK